MNEQTDNFVYSASCYIQWKHQFCSISKIGGGEAFSVDLPKPYVFYATIFFASF